MKTLSKTVLITGVSTGIGMGTAQQFIRKGYKVIGSVRKDADAERLKKQLGHDFIPIFFDVTDEKQVQLAAVELEKKLSGSGLAGLINNAGIATGGPLTDMSMDTIRQHFEVNVFGLLNVTKAFLPLLGARQGHSVQSGKIINISSVAGKIGVPFLGAYSGSKFAVEGLSESLRKELQLYGIDVLVIGPGNVVTPIWDKSGNVETYKTSAFYNMYKRFYEYIITESKNGYTMDEFGQHVLTIFEKKKPSVRYALVKERMKDWTIPRLLPSRMLDRMLGKAIGLIK
jgi:short-subunit dehydrogenase